jgi:hypothetical protein
LICKSLKELKLQSSTEYEISTQAQSSPKQAINQKSQENKLVCKSYAQDTLFINFKITLKSFGFKLDSVNKSCRARLLVSSKIGLTIFGVFYEFLSILQVGCFANKK